MHPESPTQRHSDMSWVTLTWSMIASACGTLAVIYFLAWRGNRAAWANLLFAVTALSTALFAFGELWVMRSRTPAELRLALTCSHVPLFFLLVSMTWFVRIYLGVGRLWLAWTITGLRAFTLFANLLLGQNVQFRAVTELRHMQFLGESVTILGAVPNPITPVTQLATLLVLIFVADATVTAWRRGDRRALPVGGSMEVFLIGTFGLTMAVLWSGLQAPIVYSPFYLGVVAAMGLELSRDAIRASHLFRALQVSNAQNLDLLRRLIATQETERSRIARDLHDDVSQRIAGISIHISSLKKRLQHQLPDAEVADSLSSLQQMTFGLADEIRHLSHELHPSILQQAGLVASLAEVCNTFEKSHRIAVIFDATADISLLDTEAALCLYRVTQEALRNVAKHAEARRVTVTLTATTDRVHLSIGDDGKGFELGASRGRAGGLGLVSIDERVRLLRGSMAIATAPQGGTLMQVQIPRPGA
jgi:signal transduction histidine kinase